MRIFNRISATLTSKVEKVVSHMEDHDAVAEAALHDTRAALATARVRLERIKKDGNSLRQKLQETERMATVWTDRAKLSATADEAKALECVARRNRCQREQAQLVETLTRHEDMERKMQETVVGMEQRLAQMTQQRNILRSRHSAADAMRTINRIENHVAGGIEDIFDRWEMRVLETEYQNGSATSEADVLDADFTAQENADSLRADLTALLSNATETPKE